MGSKNKGTSRKTAMPFNSFLKFSVCVLCFYLFLHRSQSQNVDDEDSGSNSSSQGLDMSTPIIQYVNVSTKDLLLPTVEANHLLVSNTSIHDIFNDNETQQLLIRYRERKRQVRILSIQRDILQKLGLTRGPNVTARFSAEERQSLLRSFDRTMMERTAQNGTNSTSCGDSEDDTC